uniref:Fignl1 interacting regulator of recombination and mitosis n=1 Tax=Nothobranchius furzeri TaxID=105023 RepID=A0A8C6Q6E0_NOTFU
MSQTNTSLLDEVAQWSQETCRQELKSVLPKLTSLHCESDTWDDHLRILKVIIDLFLPHVGLPELEDECFSKILPKAVEMFNSMMKEIMDQVGGLSTQNTEMCAFLRNILQMMMQVVDALSVCVRHVGSFEEAPHLDAIHSLPTCILKILRETFQHCKDSELVYCDRLSLVADLLQGLFKEAFSLQKSLLELLDRISLDMIHGLLDICSIISNLDLALHANTWKFLIKQSLKYQSLVEEHLHHGDIINGLCDNFLASFDNSVELAEQMQRLFQKHAKMCRFFANTVVHYIKEFKYFVTKHCRNFHQLYLQIISKFPPSISAPALPSALAGELNAAALVPMDAFLLQLLSLRSFAEVVLQQNLRLTPEHELPQCVLLVNILGQLAGQSEEVQQLWYSGSQFSEDTPRLPLYQAIFSSFHRCYTERGVPVLLPGVMLKGQAQVQVTLHQHICVQLCASVAVLPPVYFPVFERCLVDAVLQADTQTALLATDVWCFTFFFCQVELVAHFPPSKMENLPVWHHVLLRALSEDTRLRVEAEITELTQKVLTDWQGGGHKLGQMDQVALLCLDAVVSQKCADYLLLAALEFLSSLGKIFIPLETQSQVLPRQSSLFGVILADQSWLLQQHALEAFSFFAENTNHEVVISQSLCVEETKTKVVNYLRKNKSVFNDLSTQPRAKRARQEASAEEEYSRYIQTAQSALKALRALVESDADTTASPPPWLEERLQELQTLVADISSVKHAP